MNTMIHAKKPKIHSNKPSHQISVLSFLVIIEKISPTKKYGAKQNDICIRIRSMVGTIEID